MYLYCQFHVIINFEEGKLLVGNPFGDIIVLLVRLTFTSDEISFHTN